MTPQEYKNLFDQSHEVYNSDKPFDIDAYFNPDIPDNEIEEIPDIPLSKDIALDMLRAKVLYWEHYGWVVSCNDALYGLVFDADYDQAQQLASWLMADAPKGVARQYPELVQYAAGEFPKEEVARYQERMAWWGERKQQTRAIIPQGTGSGLSFQAFVEQRTATTA